MVAVGVDTPLTRDAAVSANADADAGPPAPWTGGTYTLPRPPTNTLPLTAWCGSAHPIVLGGYWPDAHHACGGNDGWLYMDASGSLGRVHLTDGMFQQLTGSNDEAPAAIAGCQSDGLMLGMHALQTQNDAIVQFNDLAQPGIVRWWLQRHPYPGSSSWGGLAHFVVGDSITAWVWIEPDGPAHLVVAGPHAENPREIPVAADPEWLSASDMHLIFDRDGDLVLWTAGATTGELLTHDQTGHAHVWISGNRIVWEVQNGAAPGLYAMDLETRTPTRITQTPPAQYRVQRTPVVNGDWVVWADYRNASPGSMSDALANQIEIWGYNFTTRREYPIQTGAYLATQPLIFNGMVYFLCSPSTNTAGRYGVFSMPLPSP